MSRLALACAVVLASLFAIGAQADAATYKRDKPHAGYSYGSKSKAQSYSKRRKKAPVVRKANKRSKAMRHFRQRYFWWFNRRARYHRPNHRFH